MRAPMPKLVCFAVVALAVTSAACDTEPKLYPVSGKVMYRGAPAAGATVSFRRQGEAGDDPIVGVVQQDGSFELLCGSQGRGAPPGNYDVFIEWKRATAKGKRRPQHGPDKLKGRYADPKRPRLRATVEANATNLPAFEVVDSASSR
jgi:hypothetical protein